MSLFVTMEFKLFLLFALLMDNTGFSSAEIPVFVKTRDSVQLDIHTQDLPEFDILSWSNEKVEDIVRYRSGPKEIIPHPNYKDRVEFNKTSFSLTLKNMQKTDSGLYRAKAIGRSDNIIAKYRVSVIDEVEDPVLTLNSNWSSPDNCSFTCEGSSISISSIYNGSSCSREEVTSADHHTLRLRCSGHSIICNYSNPVSSKTQEKKVLQLCPNQETGKHVAASGVSSWIIVFICLFSLVAVIFSIYKIIKGTQKNEQTIYKTVDENNKPQKSLKMLEKSENPQTVYDTARDSGQTDVTNHTTPNDDPSAEKSKPVTIYCAIQQHPTSPKTETDHTIYAAVNKPSVRYESAHPQSEKKLNPALHSL